MSNQLIFSDLRLRWLLVTTACMLMLAISLQASAKPITLQEPPNKGLELEAKDMAVREKLAAMIDKIMADPAVNEKIQLTGEHRTVFCRVCHGEDGIAKRPHIPNLAGQNPVYLLDQFQRFGDGRRYDRAMTALAETFTEDEKVLLALYFSMMQPQPTEIQDRDQWSRGKNIYDIACAQCHGKNGRGEKGYARLAGQQAEYVLKMLKEFRNSTGRRFNPWMTAVTTSLTEEEMADVAAYVSAMK